MEVGISAIVSFGMSSSSSDLAFINVTGLADAAGACGCSTTISEEAASFFLSTRFGDAGYEDSTETFISSGIGGPTISPTASDSKFKSNRYGTTVFNAATSLSNNSIFCRSPPHSRTDLPASSSVTAFPSVSEKTMVPVLCRPKQVLDEEEGSDTLFIVGVLVFVSGVTVNGVLLVDKVIVGGVLSLDVESEREIVSSKVEA